MMKQPKLEKKIDTTISNLTEDNSGIFEKLMEGGSIGDNFVQHQQSKSFDFNHINNLNLEPFQPKDLICLVKKRWICKYRLHSQYYVSKQEREERVQQWWGIESKRWLKRNEI